MDSNYSINSYLKENISSIRNSTLNSQEIEVHNPT